jgi:ammonium transporter, Amt family
VANYDGTVIPGGWLDHHWIQLGFHLADSAAGLSYSFVMTVSIALSHLSAITLFYSVF